MADAKTIDLNKLKAAVDTINGLNVEGVDKMRTVGIKKESMALLFMDAVAFIDKVDENLLPQEVIDVYNDLPAKKDLVEAGGTTEKKPPKEKKERAKKEPKEKKPPVEKSRYGHTQTAKSGQLDDAMFEGGTLEDIMKKCDIPRTRFASHFKHLKDQLGLTITVTEDPEKNAMKTHYKVVEERLVPKQA